MCASKGWSCCPEVSGGFLISCYMTFLHTHILESLLDPFSCAMHAWPMLAGSIQLALPPLHGDVPQRCKSHHVAIPGPALAVLPSHNPNCTSPSLPPNPPPLCSTQPPPYSPPAPHGQHHWVRPLPAVQGVLTRISTLYTAGALSPVPSSHPPANHTCWSTPAPPPFEPPPQVRPLWAA